MRNLAMAVVLLAAWRVSAEEAKPAAAKKSAKEVVTISAEDLKWEAVPETGGVQMATLWGDYKKGAHGMMAKFPAGVMHPLHTHTNDVKVIVVSGTFVYVPDGGAEKKFGPGSYVMIPGKVKHVSGCDKASACVLFQEGAAKFDFKPVAAAGAPAAKKAEAAPAKK